MKRFLFLLLMPFSVDAQWTWHDDFTAPFSFSSRNWSGDTSSFVVDTALQLNAPASTGVRILSKPSTIRQEAEWLLSVQLHFNPSSSNYTKVFVWADGPSPNQAQNGAYLKIGGNTSDQVVFGLKTNGQEEDLIVSPPALLNKEFIDLQIRLTVDASQVYQLEVDTAHWKGQQWINLGSAQTTNSTASQYFILQCFHTSTRADKFFFDDFYVSGQDFIDDASPQLLHWKALPDRKIVLEFNELLDSLEVLDPDYFHLIPSIAQVEQIAYSARHNTLTLSFPDHVSTDQDLSLHIQAIPDLSGNRLDTLIGPWKWQNVPWNEVLIAEVLADPSPVVALPESEGLELCNLGQQAVQLWNWQLSRGSLTFSLDSLLLPPGECVWITDETQCNGSFPCVEVQWPSNFLPNESGTVRLLDARHRLVDLIHYSNAFYAHPVKKEGGWTLERQLNSSLSCPDQQIWLASNEAIGGSPGRMNEQQTTLEEFEQPSFGLVQYYWNHSDSLELLFSELILSAEELILQLNGENVPFRTNPMEEQILSAPFQHFQFPVSCHLSGQVSSCSGNQMVDTTFFIHQPIPQAAQQWTFTEILFDTDQQQVEFVELQNNSQGPVDLRGLRLCKGEGEDLDCSDPIEIPCLLAEGGLLVISGQELSDYMKSRTSTAMTLGSFPTLNDDGQQLLLLDSALNVLASVRYHADQHSLLLADPQGYSLCREGVGGHWHSNSQYGGQAGATCNHHQTAEKSTGIRLSSECISPNNDGHQDVLEIALQLTGGMHLSQIQILDGFGNTLCFLEEHLVSDGLIYLIWNGEDDLGQRLPIGTYFLLIESEDEKGDVKKNLRAFSVCR